MLPIGLKLKSWALTAWAVLLVIVGAYVMGSRASKKAAKHKSDYEEALRTAAGAKGVHDVDVKTNALPTGGAGEQLRNDWMRDKDAGADDGSKADRGNGA